MIIHCENCGTKLKTDHTEIIPPGSKIRCSACGHVSSIGEEGSRGGEDNTQGRGQDSISAIRDDAPDRAAPTTQNPEPSTFFSRPLEAGSEITGEVIEEKDTEGLTFRYPLAMGVDRAEEDVFNGRSKDYMGEHGSETLPGDEGNWEEFVSISKTDRELDDFRIKDRNIKKHESDFDWESLRINDEPVGAVSRVPRMFEDEGSDDELRIMRDEGEPGETGLDIGPRETQRKERKSVRYSPENLSVDMDVLASNPHSSASWSRPSYHDSFRVHQTKHRPQGGIFTRAAYTLLTMIVFAVIIGASYIILSNTGIIPTDTADRVEKLARSLVPVGISGSLKKEVVITAHHGKWVDTRNGPMYVVSGTVTNESANPVNYIKIRSEFISEGQVVYDNVVYAGNTFTDNELRVSPLQDTLLKLKKRSGDIDFYNAEKLAGLNSNIQPGESIPFYTVFPASARLLGLKYDLEVTGYE